MGSVFRSRVFLWLGFPLLVSVLAGCLVLTAVLWAAVPTLAAACTIKVDLITHFSIWLVLPFIIFSGDGRMFGAFIGAKIVAPRQSLRAMRMVIGVMAAGTTQLAVLAVALHTYNIDEKLAVALILGAVVIELLTPVRKAFAHRAVELESELEAQEANGDRYRPDP